MTTSKTLRLKKPLDLVQQARLAQVLNGSLSKESIQKEKEANGNQKPPLEKALLQEREQTKPRDNNQQNKQPKDKEKKGTFSDVSVDTSAAKRFHLKRKALKEAVEWLCMTYPRCFNQESPKPLSIGILGDILREGNLPYSKTFLRKTLGFYTRSPLYQKAILQLSQRYLLNGEVSQDITEYEKENARKTLFFLEEQQMRKNDKESYQKENMDNKEKD